MSQAFQEFISTPATPHLSEVNKEARWSNVLPSPSSAHSPRTPFPLIARKPEESRGQDAGDAWKAARQVKAEKGEEGPESDLRRNRRYDHVQVSLVHESDKSAWHFSQSQILRQIRTEMDAKDQGHRYAMWLYAMTHYYMMVTQLLVAALIAISAPLMSTLGWTQWSGAVSTISGVVTGCLVLISAFLKSQSKMEAHLAAHKSFSLLKDRLRQWQLLMEEEFSMSQSDFLRKAEQFKQKVEEAELACAYPLGASKSSYTSAPSSVSGSPTPVPKRRLFWSWRSRGSRNDLKSFDALHEET